MSTAEHPSPRIVAVVVDDAYITAVLGDGRRLAVPLSWSWRLQSATPAQRAASEISPDGQGVRWADIDEDLSLEGFLHGTPAPRPPRR